MSATWGSSLHWHVRIAFERRQQVGEWCQAIRIRCTRLRPGFKNKVTHLFEAGIKKTMETQALRMLGHLLQDPHGSIDFFAAAGCHATLTREE